MPTKGKLPTAKEMEGQVLAALQELDGEAYYAAINERVAANLKPFVLVSELKKESQSFYGKFLADRCAQARKSLRVQETIERGNRKGFWRISRKASPKPSKVRKPGTSRVSNFAAEAIERLEKQRVSPTAINSILELFWEFTSPDPEPRQGNEENREVEAKAIAFILREEKDKGWQRPQNPNNPGFDLCQTDRRGRVICWCEVKGLSGKFSRVSLTKTEFEEALKRGERYWLYIVENVGRGKPNLIRINNPAGKAERFTYRHPAWRSVAEK